jgi:hypothetical protein
MIEMSYFKVPVNLPHAATIVNRIELRLESGQLFQNPDAQDLIQLVESLQERVGKYEGKNDPPDEEAAAVIQEASEIGREIVNEIERLNIGEDKLGQLIRNFFECLGLGEEGASISLRAGEDPHSLMRP